MFQKYDRTDALAYFRYNMLVNVTGDLKIHIIHRNDHIHKAQPNVLYRFKSNNSCLAHTICTTLLSHYTSKTYANIL